jgi:hypothetical protein
MTALEKAEVISEKILSARRMGLELIYDRDSLTSEGYDLWVNHDGLTDIFIIRNKFEGGYTLEVPGCEMYTEDFGVMIEAVSALVWELAR